MPKDQQIIALQARLEAIIASAHVVLGKPGSDLAAGALDDITLDLAVAQALHDALQYRATSAAQGNEDSTTGAPLSESLSGGN